MLALPNITDPKQAIRTFQSEALHFRRGIRECKRIYCVMEHLLTVCIVCMTENFRCWDCEWEIPVPKVDGKPKFEVIQRAWYVSICSTQLPS
jgi:hypothetical protein